MSVVLPSSLARLLGPLDEAEASKLLALAVQRTYTPGQAVFFEGTPVRRLQVLEEGRIRLSKSRPDASQEILAYFRAPSLFGHVATLAALGLGDARCQGTGRAHATATAVEPSLCYELPLDLLCGSSGDPATDRLSVKLRLASLRCLNHQLRAILSRFATLADAKELVERLTQDLGSWSLPDDAA